MPTGKDNALLKRLRQFGLHPASQVLASGKKGVRLQTNIQRLIPSIRVRTTVPIVVRANARRIV